MPKEQRKRGRRAEKKRTKERTAADAAAPADPPAFFEDYTGAGADGDADITNEVGGPAFYGLLTEDESEYFKRADELLEGDAFGDAEERRLFLVNVFREAAGKELKLAHSQGCSRLLERLVREGAPAQLKGLMRAFSGHFINAVQHRFASHCCETLFVHAAPIATREMDPDYVATDDSATESASMESLFLSMVDELRPQLKELMVQRFASHTVRTVLLILAGRPVASESALVASRKKEGVGAAAPVHVEEGAAAMAVPERFTEAGEALLGAVNEQFGTEELRALAVHTIGSPALQVVIQLEMALPKKKEEKEEEKEEKDEEMTDAPATNAASGFFQNLLYDPVGSHLAENMMRHAPKKEFYQIYDAFMKGRMGSLARNETAAFVVQRVLERLDKPALSAALADIGPQVPGLIERSRVAVLKTLIDACITHSLDASSFADSITAAYTGADVPLVLAMLALPPAVLTAPAPEKPLPPGHPASKPSPQMLHGSLLAQSLLSHASLAPAILDSLHALPAESLIALAKHSTGSHVVQAALGTSPAARRRLLHPLLGHFAELAQHPVGSHIVDAAWAAPMNLRQQIAAELAAAEPVLRESFSGRAVWRNWGMDRYKTARRLWYALDKEEKDGRNGKDGKGREKSAIELARERHAANAAKGRGTGANGPLGKKRGAGEAVEAAKRQKVH
ncbi:armadillo-type protein [Geopyxis carbonaria]|nr:armadillo-type protein [Geopyxis carbonaria]